MIRSNAHKYSVSALCKCLGVARSTYYYSPILKEDPAEADVEQVFRDNRSVYGSRKFKSHKAKPIDTEVPNELNRVFNGHPEYGAIVSDLTYVRVNYKWNYICILLDLFNREIIGYSAGPYKDAQLVLDAFATVPAALDKIQLFHTDRGSEFNNNLIDDVLETFGITRSFSLKGCPYDNSVAESTFKSIKAEFVYRPHFSSLSELRVQLADFVHWFNTQRIHSTLGYLSPSEYKAST